MTENENIFYFFYFSFLLVLFSYYIAAIINKIGQKLQKERRKPKRFGGGIEIKFYVRGLRTCGMYTFGMTLIFHFIL